MQTEMVIFTHFFGGAARRQVHLDTWIFLWVNYRNCLPWFTVMSLLSLSFSLSPQATCRKHLSATCLPPCTSNLPLLPLPLQVLFPTDASLQWPHAPSFTRPPVSAVCIIGLFHNYVLYHQWFNFSLFYTSLLYWCLSNIARKTMTSIKFFETEIEHTGSVTSVRVFKRSSRFCIGYIARDLDKPTARHDKLRGNSRPVLREIIGWALRVA